MSKWIRKGDRVVVTAGNSKGKTGEVLARNGEKILVQGVNLRIRHTKRTQQAAGGRIEREFPLHISNIALCNQEGKALKVRVREAKEGRELFYRDGEKEVVLRSVKEGRK